MSEREYISKLEVVAAKCPMQTLTLRDKKWHYKGEGNANIVIALPENNTVVRMMKYSDKTTATDLTKIVWMRVNYCKIIRQLFFNDYIDIPIPMSMAEEELCEINQYLQQDRLPNRKHKNLGWMGGLVTVYPDYTILPKPMAAATPFIYCAEIKPKQGWLHEDDRKMTGALDKCFFCAHQYLKLSRGDIQTISKYCPMDLFSGCRERVKHAVKNLFHSPQNNLKIFLDGIPLDPGNNGSSLEWIAASEAFGFKDCDQLCAFISAALLGDFDGEMPILANKEYNPSTLDLEYKLVMQSCNFHAVPMPRHCVLHRILKMQRMQMTNFESVCAEYKKLQQNTQFEHVDSLILVPEDSDEVILSPVDGYLVASTARDCSVFVTFYRTSPDSYNQQPVVQFGDHCYTVCVKVSDLDPKPYSTIEKHLKRNTDVLLASQHYLNCM